MATSTATDQDVVDRKKPNPDHAIVLLERLRRLNIWPVQEDILNLPADEIARLRALDDPTLTREANRIINHGYYAI